MSPYADDGLDDGSLALVVAPSAGEGTCLDLVAPEDPRETHFVAVSFTTSVDELIDEWDRHLEAPPAGAAVVTLDAMAPGPDAEPTAGSTLSGDALAVETVPDPSNLTRLGVAITEFLSDCDDAETLHLCLSSLTVLLQYAGVEQVSQFLHALSGQVVDHDAVAYAPIDPGAHDERTLRTLMQFCDVTVDRRG